ncbi:MAG: hypothetical protein JWR58_2922, partial [Pseudonocardia sp.]|nr:hypothetical protein [Pseudonocardia sp.]
WLRLPTASPTMVRLPLLLTGNPCRNPRGEVRRAAREHLLVGVEGLAVPHRERTPGEHIVGVGHDRHADGGEQKVHQVGDCDRWQLRRGQPAGYRSDHPDADPVQREHGGGACGQQHREQRSGHAREQDPDSGEERDDGGGQRQRQRRTVDLPEAVEERREVGEERAALDGTPVTFSSCPAIMISAIPAR